MGAVKQPKVLVVEDDDPTRDLLTGLLTLRRYAVVEAATFDQALHAVVSDPVDVVLLDLLLGHDKSGLLILDQLRSRPDKARVPVIIVTGVTLTEDDEDRIRSAGAYVFYKPVDSDELLAYVERLTETERPF